MKKFIHAAYKPEDGYWYLCRHGVGPGCWPKDAMMLEYKEHPDNAYKCYVKLSRMLTTSELKEYDLKEEMPTDVEGKTDTKYFANMVNCSSDVFNQVMAELEKKITEGVKEYMCGPRGGFEEERDPSDKWSMPWYDYAEVKVQSAPIEQLEGYIEVRVNAELDYDSFMYMFDILNPILESFDPSAYFEMEDPGRAVAYVKVDENGSQLATLDSATELDDDDDDEDFKEDMFDQAESDEAFELEQSVAANLGLYFDFSVIRGEHGSVYIFSDPDQENDVDMWMGDDDAEVGRVEYRDWAYALVNALQSDNPEAKFTKFVQSQINQ